MFIVFDMKLNFSSVLDYLCINVLRLVLVLKQCCKMPNYMNTNWIVTFTHVDFSATQKERSVRSLSRKLKWQHLCCDSICCSNNVDYSYHMNNFLNQSKMNANPISPLVVHWIQPFQLLRSLFLIMI